MTHHPFHSDCSVYPGAYTAFPETEALLEKTERKTGVYPPAFSVNMSKGPACIILESALPGFSRENIFISGFENLLSINVLPDHQDHAGEKPALHEINNEESLHRFILLPGNADPEFGSAGYRNGMLHICIPLSRHPLQQKNFRIMVY
jgi:HSP20 family molecular chaperone IbpA